MRYFERSAIAERYAHGRPYVHPLVVRRIRDALALDHPVPRALDVGCSTGQSALVLTDIAAVVVGTDVSREMVAHAPRDLRIHYLVASAKRSPVADRVFGLITAALAFHWFDRGHFLCEAHRLLEPGGWLVIYANGFRGQMRENPDVERSVREEYLARYPCALPLCPARRPAAHGRRG